MWRALAKSYNRRVVGCVMTCSPLVYQIFLHYAFRKPMFPRNLSRIAIGQYLAVGTRIMSVRHFSANRFFYRFFFSIWQGAAVFFSKTVQYNTLC